MANLNDFIFVGGNTATLVSNIISGGNVTASYFIGNGSALTGVTATSSYGNSNVSSYLASGTDTANITTTGNINAAYFHGDGSNITGLAAGNYSNTNVSAYLNSGTYTANVTTSGNVNAGYLWGDGSNISNFPEGNTLTNGTSNVVVTFNGNISFTVAGTPAGNIGAGNNGPVAIGSGAGQYTQGLGAVAIGGAAGLNTQGFNAIAIGSSAGAGTQKGGAVAIGGAAGFVSQGGNAIAIGYQAGYSGQANNTIILNATGLQFSGVSGQQNSFYVDPIRNDTGNTTTAIYYNTATKEVTYAPAGAGSSYGNANVSAYLADGTNTANIITTGNISGGNVIGTYLWGDASNLTNVPFAQSITFGGNNLTIGPNGTTYYETTLGDTYAIVGPSYPTVGNLDLTLSGTQGNIQISPYDYNGVGTGFFYFDNTGNMTLPGNAGGINYANGVSILDGIGGGNYGNANVELLLSDGSLTGNITTSGNMIIDGTGELFVATDNGHGGASYAGIMTMTNTSGGATNPNKFIRLNDVGTLEIVNSAYSAVIMTLTDNGNLIATGNLSGAYLYGDGSNLTNLNVAAGTEIINGATFVNIPSANGNITFQVNGLRAGLISTVPEGATTAFGLNSGGNQGQYATAIGAAAGTGAQGASAVALGRTAGQNTQGTQAVALGTQAGVNSQGASAVAVGFQAGFSNQGSNSIAIGAYAGLSSQGANSIVINATGNTLDSPASNTFTVAPVRNDTSNITNAMYYNTSTYEITWGPAGSSYGNANVSAYLADGTNTANIITSGNITGGNVIGAYLWGDGSNITGLSATTGNITFNDNFIELNPVSTQGTIYVSPDGGSGAAYFRVPNDSNASSVTTQVVNNAGGVLVRAGGQGDTPTSLALNYDGTAVLTGETEIVGNLQVDGNITGSNIGLTTSYLYGDGSNVTNLPAGRLLAWSGQNVILGPDGFLSFSSNDGANVTALIGPNYPNPTADLVLDSIAGNVLIAPDDFGGAGTGYFYFDSTGNITLPSDTSNINYSNGVSILGDLYNETDVVALLESGTLTSNIITTGNVSGTYVLGNGAFLTDVIGNYADANVEALLESGTVANNIVTTATVMATTLETMGAEQTIITGNTIGSTGTFMVLDPKNDGSPLTGNVNVLGNLTVTGNITYVNIDSSSTANLVWLAAADAVVPGDATGGGLAVGNLITPYATFTYNSGANIWQSNLGITATGNITASYFLGNGSQLTGMYGNADVSNYLASGTDSANIATSGYLLGNVAFATGSVGNANVALALSGGDAGQIVYQSGANSTSFLGAGTSGYVLQANGTNAPSWTNSLNIGNVTLTQGGSTGSPIVINSTNTRGGAGYAEQIQMTNAGGGSNPNKYIRINNTGGLEILNSAYSATLMILTDSGNLSLINGGAMTAGEGSGGSGVAFIAGSGAQNNIALQMNNNMAVRDVTNGASNMYFDVSTGGTTNGTFVFRSSSSYTQFAQIDSNGIKASTPYLGKTPYNSALATEVAVDNYRFRIANSGGIFPQIISNTGGTVDTCWSVTAAITGQSATIFNNQGALIASGSWTSLWTNHGMDTRGDSLIATVTDKNAGKIYRVTFVVTNNAGNTTGYNIIVERIL